MSINKPFDFFIQWHLTEKCNLWCKHCYQGERSIDEMSLPEAKKVIAEVSAMIKDWSEAYDIAFSPSFNITGGEPFLRRDLFDILGEIKKNNFEIFLLTNGTLVDQARTGCWPIWASRASVSIEEAEESTTQSEVKEFCRVCAGIERLVDAGIPVTLNVTLSNLNAGQIKSRSIRLSHQAQRVGFSRLVPYGRDGHADSDPAAGTGEGPVRVALVARNKKS
jgi:MoaA/NifB/PqqE/SkfB family radical SAM enzyme